MATEKQMRNGADGTAPTHDFVPSDATDWEGPVSSMKATAESAAATYSGYGHTVMSGQTAQTSDLTLGNTWVWDDGIAVAETPGEYSMPGNVEIPPGDPTPPNVTGKGGS